MGPEIAEHASRLLDHSIILLIIVAVVRMYLACRRVKALQDQRKAEIQKGTQAHASYMYM